MNFLKKRKNKIILSIIILALTGIVLSNQNNKSKEKPVEENTKLTVNTSTVQYSNIQEKIKLTGTVLPEEEVKISPKTMGDITAIYADSGSFVKAGQILARVDSSDLVISRQAAQAQLMEAQAAAKITFNKSRPQEIASARQSEELARENISIARAALAIAEANYKKAQKDRDRYFSLYKQGAISALDNDSASTNYDIALSQLSKARADLNRAQADYYRTKDTASLTYEGSRPEDKSIAVAKFKQAKANLNSIQKEISNCQIVAPVDGYIVKRNIKLGSKVSSQDVAFILIRHNELVLQANAAESDLFKLKPGQVVDITSSINPNLNIKGRIKKIEPYIDPQTRIGNIKIALPNSKEISYGMFLNGTVEIANKKSIVIPEDAVLFRSNKNIVFKIDNKNIVHEAEVQPGTRDSGKIEVLSGLNAGDTIIVDGAGFLYDGDKVRVLGQSSRELSSNKKK